MVTVYFPFYQRHYEETEETHGVCVPVTDKGSNDDEPTETLKF